MSQSENRSVFSMMKAESLTNFKILYDFKTKKVLFRGSKLWDDSVKFEFYNKKFTIETPIIDFPQFYTNKKFFEGIFAKNKIQKYIDEIVNLMKQGKHIFLNFCYLKSHDIRFVACVHSDTLGITSRMRGIRAGGIRRHGKDEDELEVIKDGMNLGRAMSFKNYAANCSYGGCKIVVICDELKESDLESIGFLTFCMDKNKIVSGPDMGFPSNMGDWMLKYFKSINMTGKTTGLGATGIPTAYGVFLAIKEMCKIVFSNESLKDRTVAVQGLGTCGYNLCKNIFERDPVKHLYVTDIRKDQFEKLKKEYSNQKITFVKPEEIFSLDCDIFSPNAIGGIITEERIKNFKCKIICGAANNQLKATSQEEEIRLANLIEKRGILFQVAWWHNVGGVLCGIEEYENKNPKMENVMRKIEETAKEKTYENIVEARKRGISPTENAYVGVESFIYQ